MKKLFIYLFITTFTLSLNAMLHRPPQKTPGTAAMIKNRKIAALENYKKLANSRLNDKIDNETEEYITNLRIYQNSILPRLDYFLFGTSQLLVGGLCAFKAYKIIHKGEDGFDASFNFSLFLGGAGNFLYRGYANCKKAFFWKSVIQHKIDNAKNTKTS